MRIELGGDATGPLAGVQVLDLSTVVSGPLCTQILGDLGADVIKIEAPVGDTSRYLGFEGPDGMSGLFAQINRNKRSVRLDLKSEAGCAAFRRLAARADIVVENFRPGVSDRLGIGFELLRVENPGLIWVAISGFGPDGPYAEQPAYDMVIQGMSGFAKLLGSDGEPKLISNLVADKTSAMTACWAVLAALFARERAGGRGQRIEVPMLDAFSSFVLIDALAPRTFGGDPPPPLPVDLYRSWATADGHVALIVVEDRQFQALCLALGRDDVAGDERYASLGGRIVHAAALFEILETEIAKWTTAELVARAHAFGAPLGPINDLDAFLADPQVQSNRTVFELPDTETGEVMALFRSPPRYESTPTNVRRAPPRLGEHTDEVLREAGLSDAEIAAASGS